MVQRQRRRVVRRSAAPRLSGRARTLALSTAAIAIVVVAIAFNARSAGATHPTPRDMDHASMVVDAERYADTPDIQVVYRQAAEVASVLDGIFCYCMCARTFGHYSLLECFASDHGAFCDICLREASMAHGMTQDGQPLQEIRKAIDGLYGGVV